jgi:hypothetical protein
MSALGDFTAILTNSWVIQKMTTSERIAMTTLWREMTGVPKPMLALFAETEDHAEALTSSCW